MPCEEIAPTIAGVVDGSARLDRSDRRHVDQCLRCQAELARYRRLLRAMEGLRTEIAPPPAGLLGDLLVHLEEAGERHTVRTPLSGRRVVYLGGIAAATAAAGAGAAIVIVSRGRRGRFPLAG